MTALNTPHFELRPLTGTIGAEVANVDLAGDAPDALIDDLRAALDRYLVVAVRDQRLEPQAFHRVARRLGPFSGNPVHRPLEGFDDVVRFDRPADQPGRAVGDSWHMDLAWFERPPAMTMLYAETVPAVGGDTVFTSLAHAYDALSGRMREMLATLTGVHSGKGVFDTNASLSALSVQPSARAVDEIETRHPLVCTHAGTGRKQLFISSVLRRFDGMTEAESRPIIDFLLAHATQPRFTCRVRWYQGTLMVWANSRLLHAAIDDYAGEQRVVLRTTVEGVVPQRCQQCQQCQQ
ncbi:MAG: TauD/TfdA dioxygenase family protein [Gammaproteobacteria bacterium]